MSGFLHMLSKDFNKKFLAKAFKWQQSLTIKTCCTAKVLSISSNGSSGHTHHSCQQQKNYNHHGKSTTKPTSGSVKSWTGQLADKERELRKKLLQELRNRKQEGETNLIIVKDRIVDMIEVFKLVKRTSKQPFRHLLREVDKQSSPWSLLETKQESASYGPEEVLFQCESRWQMEQVASRSHWLYQCWCLQESSAKDTQCPDELLFRRTCVLLAPWLHGCRFVSNRVALPVKKPGKKGQLVD